MTILVGPLLKQSFHDDPGSLGATLGDIHRRLTPHLTAHKHLMIQDLLAELDWADVLTAEDQRSLRPLFWSHVLPYGEVKLNMGTRLRLNADLTGG
jgi:hypothetical protein